MTELTDEMWQSIEPYLPWNLEQAFHNLHIEPHWFADGRSFWYRRQVPDGISYVLVNAETGTSQPAFDHAALRNALAAITDADAFAALELLEADGRKAQLAIERKRYRFDGIELTAEQDALSTPSEILSPDGRKAAFRRDGDVWLRNVGTGVEQRLTSTGAPHFEWAKSPDQSLETLYLRRRGIVLPPILIWSTDSRKIFTYQLDERDVRSMPLVQTVPDDGSKRPVLHELRIAFTGDEILPMAHHAVIDTETGTIVSEQGGPVHVSETSGIEKREAWWSHDASRIFYIDHDRYEQNISLVELNAQTGARRYILSETSNTFVDVNVQFGGMPNVRILDYSDEFIWFSQRDGWAHLYLCDLGDGTVKSQITHGQWVVRDLLGVDEVARRVYFIASGAGGNGNPYRRSICTAAFDGSNFEVLTPEDCDNNAVVHSVGWRDWVARATSLASIPTAFSPDYRYFVSETAGMDRLSRTYLRRADGHAMAEIEQAFTTVAPDDLVWPEPFEALAADGQTPIYGAIWLPQGHKEGRSVPVLDMIYPGPHCTMVPHAAFSGDDAYAFFHAALAGALTKLGVAVVMVDGRGTPFRSKALHDLCHGNLANPGFLNDHVAALRQLFTRYPMLDDKNIGIMGHSAGGHAAARAILAYPDFYTVAVATAGSHDPRTYNCCWPEKWQGRLVVSPDGTSNYAAAANSSLARHLKGKLLVGHGDFDENVHPAVTQQFAAALVEAGKTFDMLITPNDDHSTFSRSPYVVRQKVQFLLRHLFPE